MSEPVDEPLTWVCAALRGEGAPLPAGVSAAAVIDCCRVHGTGPLLSDLVTVPLPAELTDYLSSTARAQQLVDRLRLERLKSVLGELEALGVMAVVLKGTALACSLYAHSWHRPRGDTDLLVPVEQRARVCRWFLESGYEEELTSAGVLGSYQRSYTLTDPLRIRHTFDIHWQLSNSQVFAAAFPPQELTDNIVQHDVDQLRFASLDHHYQFLHACLHRVVHLHSPYRLGQRSHAGDRLIWLYDLHLLAARIDASGWDRLVCLTIQKRMCAVVLDTLNRLLTTLSTPVPPSVISSLEGALAQHPDELSASLLSPKAATALLADFAALDAAGRWQLFRDMAFPDARYIRARYDLESNWLVPYFYLHRIVGGAARKILPSRD